MRRKNQTRSAAVAERCWAEIAPTQLTSTSGLVAPFHSSVAAADFSHVIWAIETNTPLHLLTHSTLHSILPRIQLIWLMYRHPSNSSHLMPFLILGYCWADCRYSVFFWYYRIFVDSDDLMIPFWLGRCCDLFWEEISPFLQFVHRGNSRISPNIVDS